MAKYVINGEAFVVTSSKTLEEIQSVEKYAPKALSLFEKDEDTGCRVEVFRVATAAKGKGGLNEFGAVFATEARDGSGCACATILLPDGVSDAKQFVKDNYGAAIVKLEQVEQQIGEALAKVAEDMAALEEKITIA